MKVIIYAKVSEDHTEGMELQEEKYMKIIFVSVFTYCLNCR